MTPVEFHWNSAGMVEKFFSGYENKRVKKNEKIRQDYENKTYFLMPPHPLTNFKIQKYYQNEPRINGVYARDNFQEIKR